MTTPNIAAFLTMVSHSEGTDRAADPYRCVFGFEHIISDLSDHPAVTGEWTGAHWAGGFSTAAGRYQLIKPTWLALQSILRLADFTAPSQDDAAIQLIKEKGALDLIMGGQVAEAIARCNGIWSSLPGSSSGQPQAEIADLLNTYMNDGGNLV
jgi:muramidase (phage lysozyme)